MIARKLASNSADIESAQAKSDPCPLCGSSELRLLGRLPKKTPHFGGVQYSVKIDVESLWKCSVCDLWFRRPSLSSETLIELYAELPSQVWATSEIAHYWHIIKHWIGEDKKKVSVLDVGCFRGDFLAWLPNEWEKYAIEPNHQTKPALAARGIRHLGQTVEEIPEGIFFDVIILLDVVEHLIMPLETFSRLKKHLRPGGKIILQTGATDTWAFRFFGCHYWYSSLPEHFTFFSHKSLSHLASCLGLCVGRSKYLSSMNSPSFPRKVLQFLKIALFAAREVLLERKVPEKVLRAVPLLSRTLRWKTCPWFREAKDHILFEMTTPSA